jgi:hypothetical protein
MKIYTIEDLMKDYFRGLDVLPLMTTTGMAQRWGKKPDDVYNLSRRDETFPAPLEGIVKGLRPNQKVYPFHAVVRYEKENNLMEVKESERIAGTKTTT